MSLSYWTVDKTIGDCFYCSVRWEDLDRTLGLAPFLRLEGNLKISQTSWMHCFLSVLNYGYVTTCLCLCPLGLPCKDNNLNCKPNKPLPLPSCFSIAVLVHSKRNKIRQPFTEICVRVPKTLVFLSSRPFFPVRLNLLWLTCDTHHSWVHTLFTLSVFVCLYCDPS